MHLGLNNDYEVNNNDPAPQIDGNQHQYSLDVPQELPSHSQLEDTGPQTGEHNSAAPQEGTQRLGDMVHSRIGIVSQSINAADESYDAPPLEKIEHEHAVHANPRRGPADLVPAGSEDAYATQGLENENASKKIPTDENTTPPPKKTTKTTWRMCSHLQHRHREWDQFMVHPAPYLLA
ncbi:hypothetical protein BJ912DRAFT_972740 [Pholiota molesta]|nr:hypothetical protein BJ912DRAFT_972740 [Pholiota molesta]